MQLTELRQSGFDGGLAVFDVSLLADDGTNHVVRVNGRQINDAVSFADHATAETRHHCTTEFGGDQGGWHAHLGEMLRRRNQVIQPSSNLNSPDDTVAMTDERRDALLSITGLGQVAAMGEAAVVEAPPAKEETFPERCARQAREAKSQRLTTDSKLLKLTPLGRDALASK